MLIIFKNIKENNDNQDIVFLLKVIKKQCTFIKKYKENYFYDAELSKFLILKCIGDLHSYPVMQKAHEPQDRNGFKQRKGTHM